MKTSIPFFLLLFLASTSLSASAQPAGRKMLIVCFSHGGNTRTAAEHIRSLTGADLFEIVPEKGYPSDYDTLTALAKTQIQNDERPAIHGSIDNFAQYDVIFVGSPCWWGTIAPPVATLLTSYDFAGKTIIPFMTHGGSRMGHSEADIRKLCPDATLLQALPISGSHAASARPEIEQWLHRIGLLQ